jgi:hypothetical protein
MRCIAQYEDALCEISHELKGARSLSVEARKKLRALLEELPSHDYLADIEAVGAILDETERSKRSKSKKVAKPVEGGKGSIVKRKRLGMKTSR